AYQYLLDWYLDWYVQHEPAKWGRGKNPPIFEIRDGSWQLTMEKKKEILTSHIYGVDIDAQAVEVTKLSLLLKVVENPGQLGLLTERILPDLGENIQCGNSLIGPDYYDGQQLGMFDSEEQYRVNAFDWKAAFPQVFRDGGFNAVIGNPPYIRIQAMKEWAPTEVEFYKKRYKAASKGNYDIYVVFVEKGLSLLNREGRLGFILPHKFFNAQYGEPLRGLIAEGKHLTKVVHFGDQQVFENATTYTCLMFVDKTGREEFEFEKVSDIISWRNGELGQFGKISSELAGSLDWNFAVGNESELFDRLSRTTTKLGDIAHIFQGLVTGADKVFILKEIKQLQHTILLLDRDGKEWELEKSILKPFLNDVTVSTYVVPKPSHWLIFPYQFLNGKAQLISSIKMNDTYPLTWTYLKHKASILRDRENGKWKNEQWYALGRTQNLTQMEDPKLVIQVISKIGKYAFDNQEIYFTGGGNGPYYGLRLKVPYTGHSIHYIQALLNSELLDSYLHKISSPFQNGYWSYGKRFIEQLPIRAIDFTNPADVKRHDRMVSLVESMLALHKQSAAARLPDEKERLERQIQATDRQIDRLVYELYDLTDEEIKIVEG
ncbi:MAG: Eco57I restriction-modification methylase domain-containing protein, partial [Bellilinea sp.]